MLDSFLLPKTEMFYAILTICDKNRRKYILYNNLSLSAMKCACYVYYLPDIRVYILNIVKLEQVNKLAINIQDINNISPNSQASSGVIINSEGSPISHIDTRGNFYLQETVSFYKS